MTYLRVRHSIEMFINLRLSAEPISRSGRRRLERHGITALYYVHYAKDCQSDRDLARAANAWRRFGERPKEPQVSRSVTEVSGESIGLNMCDILL